MAEAGTLKDLKSAMGSAAFGEDFEDNKSKGLCVNCKKPAL